MVRTLDPPEAGPRACLHVRDRLAFEFDFGRVRWPAHVARGSIGVSGEDRCKPARSHPGPNGFGSKVFAIWIPNGFASVKALTNNHSLFAFQNMCVIHSFKLDNCSTARAQ